MPYKIKTSRKITMPLLQRLLGFSNNASNDFYLKCHATTATFFDSNFNQALLGDMYVCGYMLRENISISTLITFYVPFC